jgi:hypothetical protein
MRFGHLVLGSIGIAAATLAHADAHAQTTYPRLVFDAVQTYSMTDDGSFSSVIAVTGVQHGASGPSTLMFSDASPSSTPNLYWQACEKQLLVMTNRPGRFSLAVSYYGSAPPPATGTSTEKLALYGCALTQLP